MEGIEDGRLYEEFHMSDDVLYIIWMVVIKIWKLLIDLCSYPQN
jgi:hypothetical protein